MYHYFSTEDVPPPSHDPTPPSSSLFGRRSWAGRAEKDSLLVDGGVYDAADNSQLTLQQLRLQQQQLQEAIAMQRNNAAVLAARNKLI